MEERKGLGGRKREETGVRVRKDEEKNQKRRGDGDGINEKGRVVGGGNGGWEE